jgi:hypothetical protein
MSTDPTTAASRWKLLNVIRCRSTTGKQLVRSCNTMVADAGLKELKDLKNLTALYLHRTQVTAAGEKELKEALPRCNILR